MVFIWPLELWVFICFGKLEISTRIFRISRYVGIPISMIYLDGVPHENREYRTLSEI